MTTKKEIDILKQEVEAYRARITALQKTIDEIKESRAYKVGIKVTSPYRFIAKILGKNNNTAFDLTESQLSISLKKRINTFNNAKQAKKKTVTIIYSCIDATFRYRGYNVTKALTDSKKWTAIFLSIEEAIKNKELIRDSSIVVFARVPWDERVQRIIDFAKENRKPIICDIDDLVCHMDFYPDLVDNLQIKSKEKSFWVGYITSYEQVAEQVDGFITTNQFLSSKLQKKFNKPGYVISNSINDEQLVASKRYINKKTDNFSMCYLSGSATHNRDFELISDQVIDILEKNPDITLHVIGKINLPKETQKLIKKKQIKVLPFMNYLDLQKEIAKAHICLVPLVENIFTDCKSELKFFESAIVGTTTVASPTAVYTDAIKDRETGYIVKDNKWSDTIMHIYKHQDENRKIAENAMKYCVEKYNGEEFVKQIEKTYNQIISDVIIKK